jgi:hypothetical protein
VPLPPLRTKANAVHAGHSQPLVSLKDSTLSTLALYSLSQNNKSLIAIPLATDAMVAGHTLLWNTLPQLVLNKKANILTLVLMELATMTNLKLLQLTLATVS